MKENSLIRKEVLNQKNNRLHGEILLNNPPSALLIGTIMLVLAALVFIFLYNSNYTRKVTVSGWLEPNIGTTKLFTSAPGIITSIKVQDGDFVKKGEPILIIENHIIIEQSVSLGSTLINTYTQKIENIHNQTKELETIFLERERELILNSEYINNQLILIESKIESLQYKHNITLKSLNSGNKLKSNDHISTADLDKLSEIEVEAKLEVQNAFREKNIFSHELSENTSNLNLLPSELNSEVLKLENQIIEFTQSIENVKSETMQTIVSPTDGIITNLQAFEGQFINTNFNTLLLSIVPKSYKLKANIYIPIHAAGLVEVHQNLTIRYDAFPYQRFGSMTGKIESISNDVLLPIELSSSPVSIDFPAYKAIAAISEDKIKTYGIDTPLKPGMTFTADIALSHRTLIEWILEPFYTIKGKL